MANDNWRTPPEVYNPLNEEFTFVLDAACNENNILADAGLCVEDCNSLEVDWLHESEGGAIWLNPPYSQPNLSLFCKKAYEESLRGCTVVALLPDDCSTKWYQDFVFGRAHEVRQLTKRVRHIDPATGKSKGSPRFGSIVVVWRPRKPAYTKFSLYKF